jgi:hypothetical protein
MRSVSAFALTFCFLAVALTTQSHAEEHYIYKNSHGGLVISNKPPPPGSNVLRKLEITEGQIQPPQGSNATQTEAAAKPSTSK